MDKNSVMFQRALAVIDASGAQYRIVMPDGTHFGTLPMAEPKAEPGKRSRKLKHPYGALRTHYLPFIGELQPDGYAEVPFGPFLGTDLASAISAYGCHLWGNGFVTVAQNNDKKVVEVMRSKVANPKKPSKASDNGKVDPIVAFRERNPDIVKAGKTGF